MVPMAPSMTTMRFSSCSTRAAIRGLNGLLRCCTFRSAIAHLFSVSRAGHRPRPSGRGGRLRAARRGGRLTRRRGGTVLEGDLLAGEADMDGPSVLQPPEQDLVGQRVAELGLDEPAQGPGPEDGVEAPAGEMGPSLGS